MNAIPTEDKIVFVSGCYDMLHSGHVAFFREAASYGKLHVGIGSDATLLELKGRRPVNSEAERLYMVKAIRYVTDARISRGSGYLDFEQDLRELKPTIFIVNEDGNSPAKADLCRELGIEYIVLKRIPEPGLTARSTTAIRQESKCLLPYRLDLAGTWIDQPYVSKHNPGWAITISVEPTIEFNQRSGMSTSTRNIARKYWPTHLPVRDPEELARMMFYLENNPGKEIISGAQDAIGICMPGLTRHYYDKQYWPLEIQSCHDNQVLDFLEAHLSLIPLWPRPDGLDLLGSADITPQKVARLTDAAANCWQPILDRDLTAFARFYQESFDAQVALFPAMLNPAISEVIDRYHHQMLAWKLTGAGGGGYLIALADKPIEGAIQFRIRRRL